MMLRFLTQRLAGTRVGASRRLQLATPPAGFENQSFLLGLCNICGRESRFFFFDPALYRESLVCEHCRSTSRYRSIARGLLASLLRQAGVKADSLAGLPATGVPRAIRVYDTQTPFRFEMCAYPVPEYLKRCSWIKLTQSVFKPDRRFGEELEPGVWNQDLERLTFEDGLFDVVLTSDVMEHVRLDGRAHREIARVIRTGGEYIFTVPHWRNRSRTEVFVRVVDPDDPEKDEFLIEPQYHGDANSPDPRGVLAYRGYGTDLDAMLERSGFRIDYTKQDFPDLGILNTELFVATRLGG